jgi:hypothetical protein
MDADPFDAQMPLTDRQAETLAALARLPVDVRAALLAPLDPAAVRVEECLPDDEVERIVAGADV